MDRKAQDAQRYRERYADPEQREQILAQTRRWYQENPEKAKSIRADYYQRNKAKILARQKVRREADPVTFNKRSRVSRQRNLEHYRRQEVNRANKRRVRVEGDLTAKEWREILEEFDYRCAYCQAQGRLTQDHIVPISRGGRHTKANVVSACGSCNSSKGAKTLLEFAELVPIKLRTPARV